MKISISALIVTLVLAQSGAFQIHLGFKYKMESFDAEGLKAAGWVGSDPVAGLKATAGGESDPEYVESGSDGGAEEEEDSMFRRWSLEEDRLLFDMDRQGEGLVAIAARLKRGLNGTKARLTRIKNVNSSAFARLFGGAATLDSPAASGLKPFNQVRTRVMFDPALTQSDFSFAYEDRFEGAQNARFDEANGNVKGGERLLVKAIPEHRILSLSYKGRVVWCKESRLDLVFGSMNGQGVKLEQVIATYDEWHDEEERKRQQTIVQVFCDLDGVLADFDQGVIRLFGKGPDEVKKQQMWKSIASQRGGGGFFASLSWMPNGRALWRAISALTPQPVILTGVPMGNWAPGQKRQWCARELGSEVKVITCLSKDKHLYCGTIGGAGAVEGEMLEGAEASKGDAPRIVSILIDDRETAREPWENAGGVFVHYRDDDLVSALRQLQLYVKLQTSV